MRELRARNRDNNGNKLPDFDLDDKDPHDHLNLISLENTFLVDPDSSTTFSSSTTLSTTTTSTDSGIDASSLVVANVDHDTYQKGGKGLYFYKY